MRVNNVFTEEQISYLNLIQEPISRMSTTSAIFKGFSATVATGLAMITYSETNTIILALSFVPVLLFAVLDVYYLMTERKFRFLYNQVREGKHIIDFEMKLTKNRDEIRIAKARIIDCVLSPSILFFYIPMIFVLVAVFILKCKYL